MIVIGLGHPIKPQAAHEAVGQQGRRPDDLRQPAGAQAASSDPSGTAGPAHGHSPAQRLRRPRLSARMVTMPEPSRPISMDAEAGQRQWCRRNRARSPASDCPDRPWPAAARPKARAPGGRRTASSFRTRRAGRCRSASSAGAAARVAGSAWAESLIGLPASRSPAMVGIVEGDHHVARQHLRVGQDLRHIVDGSAGNAGLAEDLKPMGDRMMLSAAPRSRRSALPHDRERSALVA